VAVLESIFLLICPSLVDLNYAERSALI
jgi:hypothetical protein